MTNETFDLIIKNTIKSADYAGTLGFSRGSLNLILQYVKDGNLKRIEEISHEALEQIENVFIKYQIN